MEIVLSQAGLTRLICVLMEDKDMIPSFPSGLRDRWGFLVLPLVSCGIAHGWHMEAGLSMVDDGFKEVLTAAKQWPRWGSGGEMWARSKKKNIIVWFPITDGDAVERKCSWISPVAKQWHELRYSDITKPAAKWSAEQCGAAGPTSCEITWHVTGNGQGTAALCRPRLILLLNESCNSCGVFKCCFKVLMFFLCTVQMELSS